MKISLDAMGANNAPISTVKGAIKSKKNKLKYTLKSFNENLTKDIANRISRHLFIKDQGYDEKK
jgi:fatty acid/phospholipid biosynthesis enzyme